MAKTANTVNIGDKLYFPNLKYIDEYRISGIEKSNKGITISTDEYLTGKSYAFPNPAISRIINFYKYTTRSKEDISTYYLNLEDARAKQRELQIEHLKKLQQAVINANKSLQEFTDNYIIEQP